MQQSQGGYDLREKENKYVVSLASGIEDEMILEERQVAMTKDCGVYSKYERKPKIRKQESDKLHFTFLMRLKSGCFVSLALTTVIDSSDEEKGTDLGYALNVQSAGGL